MEADIRKIAIGCAIAAAGAGASVWNYRRYIPRPEKLGNQEYSYEIQKKRISAGEKTLYGELLLPKKKDSVSTADRGGQNKLSQADGGSREKFPLVICSHGFGSSYKLTKNMIGKALAMSGYAAFCFDFYGGSNKSRSGGTMMDMSIMTEKEELLAVVEAAKSFPDIDAERIYLLGESQGGMVSALAAAECADDIRALILYYPAFCIPDDAHAKFKDKDSIPEVTQAFSFKSKVSRRYYEDAWDLDVYSEIAKYHGPVLIMHGDRDDIVPMRYGEEAAKAYENAEFVKFPGEIHGFYGRGKRKAAEVSYRFLESNR